MVLIHFGKCRMQVRLCGRYIIPAPPDIGQSKSMPKVGCLGQSFNNNRVQFIPIDGTFSFIVRFRYNETESVMMRDAMMRVVIRYINNRCLCWRTLSLPYASRVMWETSINLLLCLYAFKITVDGKSCGILVSNIILIVSQLGLVWTKTRHPTSSICHVVSPLSLYKKNYPSWMAQPFFALVLAKPGFQT